MQQDLSIRALQATSYFELVLVRDRSQQAELLFNVSKRRGWMVAKATLCWSNLTTKNSAAFDNSFVPF